VSALIQIALGGALGAVLRHLCAAQTARLAGAAFPWGTLAVNVAGSFAMGIAAILLVSRADLGRAAPFVMPGLLGGFTTFSAFSLEIVQLVERGRPLAAALYAGGSVMLGLLALMAGMWLARSGWPA
jgi:fluoride exporter